MDKSYSGNDVNFNSVGRITNKELWRELQALKTSLAVLGAEYRRTAQEVEKLKQQQVDFIRIANENLLEHERINSLLRTLGVKVGFWAVVSGAVVSVIWKAFIQPFLSF